MAKGKKDKEPNPRVVYADIIDLPHHQSPTRPHMRLYDRAAQFSSYKALSGYEDMVAEEARVTDTAIDLSEEAKELLALKLKIIEDADHPVVTFTVFVPDEKKAGGKYVEITDTVKRVDPVSRTIVLMSKRESGLNKTIEIDKIVRIQSELVDCPEE
jgi:DNA polymerase II large subunit